MPELKVKVPELEQGARTGAGSQNWGRASELGQGVRTGAGCQNWGRASELGHGVRTGARRQNWSRASELKPGNTRCRSRTAGDDDIANQLRNREELNSDE